MNTLVKSILCIAICLSFTFSMNAQDFVYKPVNPNFGGETFNYQFLLQSAQAQDLTEDENAFSFDDNSTLDDFTESLNRQLLSQLSRQLVTNQFGESGLEEGQYTIGNFQIDVNTTLEGLSVTILDSSIGDQTQIIIPYY